MITEFSTPVTTGSDETVVIKKRARISAIHVVRSGAITFETQVAHIDSATGQDRIVNRGPDVIRPLDDKALAETVTVGGKEVSLDTLLKVIAKFQSRWLAEDIAAAVETKP